MSCLQVRIQKKENHLLQVFFCRSRRRVSYWWIRLQFDLDYFLANTIAYFVVPVVFLIDTSLFLLDALVHLLGTNIFMLDTLLCLIDWIGCFLAALFFFEDTLGLIR